MGCFLKFVKESMEIRRLPSTSTIDQAWNMPFMKEMMVMATYMISHVLSRWLSPAERRQIQIDFNVNASDSSRVIKITGLPDALKVREHKINSDCINALRKCSRYLGISTSNAAFYMYPDIVLGLTISVSWKGSNEGKNGTYDLKFGPDTALLKSVLSGEALAMWRSERADTKNAEAPSQ